MPLPEANAPPIADGNCRGYKAGKVQSRDRDKNSNKAPGKYKLKQIR